jgi:hypothetical protein
LGEVGFEKIELNIWPVAPSKRKLNHATDENPLAVRAVLFWVRAVFAGGEFDHWGREK